MPLSRVLVRTIALLAPERRLATTLALANVALAGAAFAEPVLFGMIVDRLARAQASSDAAASLEGLGPLLAAWVGFGLFTIAAGVLVALHADRLAHRRRLAAMADFFEHALALPLAFHAGTHSGRALKVMIDGAGALFGLWLTFLRDQAAALVAVVVLLPATLFLNWRLGLVLVVLVLASGLLTHAVLRRTERMQGTVESHHTALAGNASDALGNVAVVQSFTRMDAELRHMRGIVSELLAAQTPVLSWWAIASVATRCAGTLTVLTLLLLGVALFREGLATIGEIVSFVAIATMLIGRLEQLVFFTNGLLLAAPKIAELFAVRDTRPAVADHPGAREPGRLTGAVAFEEVSYSYDGERPAVRDLAFRVEPGETIALVGETGSGKSTALSLLHRAFDPDAGRILLDGRDARDWTLEGLRRNIAVVFQEPMLFARSLRENLLVGAPEASDAELVAALERAQAGAFLARLPRGLDTQIGERGRSLSGGERQRVAIARALLKDAPILVLDEATSALDAVTEARLKEALAEAMRGRTTFVIAHRLATVRDADRILVLHEGRIVEEGSYDALLARGGRFARLAASQHLLQRLETEEA
ncbi:glucan ABC transporter ATP-binding protein/ permease [Salinarimonas ramus]|nr:glucan ABC transporter ATP-binding protein/ permease [Salinarimonas ramus]